ncbi:MAG TPA: ROK family protein, partial [Limnochordia bacterium]|nr:ROK family protein [Limnochordia bacterium]
MKNVMIGIDIGATNTRLAILNYRGEVQGKERIPSRMSDGKPFFDHVADLAAKMANRSKARVVGVGTAGQIDRNSGAYLPGLAPHQPWVGIPLKSIIEEKTGLPTFVDNDCKISAYAELKV